MRDETEDELVRRVERKLEGSVFTRIKDYGDFVVIIDERYQMESMYSHHMTGSGVVVANEEDALVAAVEDRLLRGPNPVVLDSLSEMKAELRKWEMRKRALKMEKQARREVNNVAHYHFQGSVPNDYEKRRRAREGSRGGSAPRSHGALSNRGR